ncbi:MAG: hypothetical protein U9Q40_07185 [Campylobacterota bacterium]|nr:hypothetical protein [Campylobacterota bacterium]
MSNYNKIKSSTAVINEKRCLEIDVLYEEYPYNYQTNIDYGRCAYFRGDIDGAMAAYDRAEILNEEDATVYKYLGDLHASIGNIEIANGEYDKADRFANERVQRSTDRLYNPNSFSVLARFSTGYDSNVKYNAELEEIQRWDINSSGKPISDSFTKEYIRLTHTYDRDAFSSLYYKSQLHGYNKNYFELSEDNFAQLQVYTGPGWASKDFDFWVPLSYTYMATDYQSYSNIYSLNPQLRKRFENGLLLRVEGEYSSKEYLQWEEGDKDIYSGELSLSKWFGSNYFRALYRYLQEEKDLSESTRRFIDKKVNEAELNYALRVNKFLEVGVGYLYSLSNYDDEIIVNVADKREDKLWKYSGYISYNITSNIGIVLQYDSYINETNYIPSNYDKEVVSGGVYFYY